jgi:signal transduction histidine kinase
VSASRVPAKAVAGMVLLLAGTGAAQLAWLDRALPGSPGAAAAAVFGPLVLCSVWLALIMTEVTRRRVEALLRGLHEVARGNFDAELPLPREPVLRAVSEAFARTGDALRRLTEKLAFADAQRRRLFSDLAHELATPSTAILGLVDTLTTPALVPGEAARAALLSALEEEALRLARLVADVRDLAMTEDPDVSFALEPADVAGLIAEALDRFRLVQPEGAEIVLRAERAVASVDAARLEQTLVNLLRNAKRYARPEGRIEVDVGPDGPWVRLVVEDSGAPLPSEVLAHLGERLYRGDPSRGAGTGGAGLGLAIVRAIVHRHGGAVTFAHGASGGLRVTIRVPAGG